MSLLCSIKHKWDGCTCVRCKRTRNEEHKWDNCTCSSCGAVRDSNHAWTHCVCSMCSKKRDSNHRLDNNCHCTICATVVHDYDADFKCVQCSLEKSLEEIARIVTDSYRIGALIVRMLRTVLAVPGVPEVLIDEKTMTENDPLQTTSRWREFLTNVITAAQNRAASENGNLEQLASNCLKYSSESQDTSFIRQSAASSHIDKRFGELIGARWQSGRVASTNEINQFVYPIITMVGNGVNMSRSNGNELISELVPMLEGDHIDTANLRAQLDKIGPNDGLSIVCKLMPLIIDGIPRDLVVFERLFSFNLAEEKAFFARLAREG